MPRRRRGDQDYDTRSGVRRIVFFGQLARLPRLRCAHSVRHAFRDSRRFETKGGADGERLIDKNPMRTNPSHETPEKPCDSKSTRSFR
jgi:hypothetical protein